MGRDVVRFPLHLGAGILHGDGQTAGAHGWQIDDVVADEGGFFQFDSFLFDDLLEGRCACRGFPGERIQVFRSRARSATVSEMRLVMSPVLMPPRRASEMEVPSWAWNPLASIRDWLWSPNPPSPPCLAECSWIRWSKMLG